MPEKYLVPNPRRKFYYPDGITSLAGGKVFTYEAGTTTKATTYTDHTGLTPNTNPIILDSEGECDIWLDPTVPVSLAPLPTGPIGPQGPPGPAGPPGPSGNATEFSNTVDIPSLTIFTGLFGQFIEIVPAPGPGIAAYPTQAVISYHYATVPYDVGGGFFAFYWGPPIIPVEITNFIMPGDVLESVVDQTILFPIAEGLNGKTINALDFVNKPITLSFDNAIVQAALISIAINNPGTGYAVNDTGTIDGGDGNATYLVDAVDGGGGVTAITLSFGGTAYSSVTAATTTVGGGQPGAGTGLTLDTVSAETIAGKLRVTVFYRKIVLPT